MAGSRIVEVRKAVSAGLATVFASDPKVKVTYGYQGLDETRQRESVFTDGGTADHKPAALKAGRNFREEEMDFDIGIEVIGIGMKPEDAEQRAVDIGTEVEEYVADRKSNEIGVPGLKWMYSVKYVLSPIRVGTKGCVSTLKITVRYSARLT